MPQSECVVAASCSFIVQLCLSSVMRLCNRSSTSTGHTLQHFLAGLIFPSMLEQMSPCLHTPWMMHIKVSLWYAPGILLLQLFVQVIAALLPHHSPQSRLPVTVHKLACCSSMATMGWGMLPMLCPQQQVSPSLHLQVSSLLASLTESTSLPV